MLPVLLFLLWGARGPAAGLPLPCVQGIRLNGSSKAALQKNVKMGQVPKSAPMAQKWANGSVGNKKIILLIIFIINYFHLF